MLQPSTQILEKARRALLEGNRAEVECLLGDYAVLSHVEVHWLLAAAVEDQAVRETHLLKVIDLGISPYAQRAKNILDREHKLKDEMNRAPAWQRLFIQYRSLIIGFIGLGVVLIGIWIVTNRNNATISEQNTIQMTTQAINYFAAETATHQPPTPTATATFFPPELTTPVSYPPFGSLRILTIEYPAIRTVIDSRNSLPELPPINSQYIAVLYEFTCGYSEMAFCTEPPEASVSLILGNGQRVPQTTLVIEDPAIPTPGILPTGSITRRWLVFPVPNGQSPAGLLISANTDSTTPTLEETILTFPIQ